MKKSKLDNILKDHKLWLAGAGGDKADLMGANLMGANLMGADLRGANLRGANLDFSCWPLWCGSLNVKLDDRQQAQLLYHAFAVSDIKPTEKQKEFINGNFHKIDEVPEL